MTLLLEMTQTCFQFQGQAFLAKSSPWKVQILYQYPNLILHYSPHTFKFSLSQNLIVICHCTHVNN